MRGKCNWPRIASSGDIWR